MLLLTDNLILLAQIEEQGSDDNEQNEKRRPMKRNGRDPRMEAIEEKKEKVTNDENRVRMWFYVDFPLNGNRLLMPC